jgi:hypothetical protein
MRLRRLFRSTTRVGLTASVGLLSLVIAALLIFNPSSSSSSSVSVSAQDPPKPASAQAVNIISSADQVLIRQCMKQQGFEYWPISQDQIDPVPRFPYVVTSVTWAKINGFGGNPGAPSTASDLNETYFNRLSPSRQSLYSDDLVGTPNGPAATVVLPQGDIMGHSALGCEAQAFAKLYGSFSTWFKASSIADDLPSVSETMVVSSPAYEQKIFAWSGCMRAKGHKFSSPGQAASTFNRLSSTAPSYREVLAAVAEAVCANSTGLTRVANHLNQVFTTEVDQRYRSALQTEWRLQQDALPRARSVLSSNTV